MNMKCVREIRVPLTASLYHTHTSGLDCPLDAYIEPLSHTGLVMMRVPKQGAGGSDNSKMESYRRFY
jgi:hypothetical protein